MNYSTKIMYALIACSTLALCASEYPDGSKSFVGAVWSAIGKSRAVTLFRKNVHAPITSALLAPHLGTVDANPEYQELGRKAQLAVGIPEEDHVPVKHRMYRSLMPSNLFAAAMADGIYVSENQLRQVPEDAQYTIMRHEAAHVKYNDDSMQVLHNIGLAGATVALLARIHKNILIKKHAGLISYPVAAGSLTASYLMNTTFKQFAERRADTTACYAAQCAHCVDSYGHHVSRHTKDNLGYLKHHETDKIARELEQKQRYCTTHKPL